MGPAINIKNIKTRKKENGETDNTKKYILDMKTKYHIMLITDTTNSKCLVI